MERTEPAEPRNQGSMLGALNGKKDDRHRTASHFDGAQSGERKGERQAIITHTLYGYGCVWHTYGHTFYVAAMV